MVAGKVGECQKCWDRRWLEQGGADKRIFNTLAVDRLLPEGSYNQPEGFQPDTGSFQETLFEQRIK